MCYCNEARDGFVLTLYFLHLLPFPLLFSPLVTSPPSLVPSHRPSSSLCLSCPLSPPWLNFSSYHCPLLFFFLFAPVLSLLLPHLFFFSSTCQPILTLIAFPLFTLCLYIAALVSLLIPALRC